jgi:hypothetical protein
MILTVRGHREAGIAPGEGEHALGGVDDAHGLREQAEALPEGQHHLDEP